MLYKNAGLLRHSLQNNFNSKEEASFSVEEAVLIIQRHERARQGRLRTKYMKEIRTQEEAEMNPEYRFKETLSPQDAAITIQRASTA